MSRISIGSQRDGLRQKTMKLTFSELLGTVRNFAGDVHEQINI